MNETGKTLECPFTWGINDELVAKFQKKDEVFVNREDQPIKAVIYPATLVFVYLTRKDYINAREKMKQVIDNLNAIDLKQLEEKQISSKVLLHIIRATKYYYYKLKGILSEAEKALASAPELELEQLNDTMTVGTLNGCKAISYLVFHEAPNKFSISYLERAILNSPACYLWHFLLGKKLRSVRRGNNFFLPGADEKMHLLKAYELSGKSNYVGVFVAQMYWEDKNFVKAREMYLQIFNSDPKSIGIRLRLSLAFLRDCDFEHAKECLDFVQSECSDNIMFLHYKAMYYEKQKNYKMAALYYNRSALMGNHICVIKYGECRKKLQDSFDYIKYFKSILNKYDKKAQQEFHLHIAMQYFFKNRDLKNALLHFKQAIELDPTNSVLKHFNNCTIDKKKSNIFCFIKVQLFQNCDLKEVENEYEELKKIIDKFGQI